MKLAALLLVLVACSKSKPAAGVVRGSCQSAPAVCEEYESTDAKYMERQKAGCNGTWKVAACAPANVAGRCREEHGWVRTRIYYRGIEGEENPAVEKAKAECGAYGTWSQ
jgi:hypothetical protein